MKGACYPNCGKVSKSLFSSFIPHPSSLPIVAVPPALWVLNVSSSYH
jgi:hypothetical protein